MYYSPSAHPSHSYPSHSPICHYPPSPSPSHSTVTFHGNSEHFIRIHLTHRYHHYYISHIFATHSHTNIHTQMSFIH
ncbi:hypothetical protein GQ42DRAFT_55244 [Ramicandelaber brevisporus]|nr:hypothetical protein GQ42DRAFT_55244 [Ramicandelaber brevisporus]